MSSSSRTLPFARAPLWFLATSIDGIVWNVFGAVRFAGAVAATEDSLIASGQTAEHAAVLTGDPGWMTHGFALGVFGGLTGSVLLLLRQRIAHRPS